MSNDEYQHQNSWIDIRGKHKDLYTIISNQLEKEFTRVWLEQDPNKSYLPKGVYITGIDPYDNDNNI